MIPNSTLAPIDHSASEAVQDQHTSPCSGSDAVASVCRAILDGSRFLVTSHARPDGDAVGSALAMGALLDQLGKDVDVVLADPVPQVYGKLPGVQRIRQARRIDPSHYDAAIILECDSTGRTGLQGYGALPILNLDHHITGHSYGTVNWIEWDASAVAVLVYRLALEMGLRVTPEMATCIYTAVFTDTGAFTYPGTAPGTLSMAQQLIDLGANADSIARDVLYSVSAAHIRLLGTALSRLRVQDRSAWSYITQADLANLHASDEDSEGTVNYLISIAGVEAAVFARELPPEDGMPSAYRVSLRSKSSLDVSVIAANCGGGGHRNAAGCVMEGTLDTAIRRVLTAVDAELAKSQQA